MTSPLKVPVTCVEGVDDATKVLETCMEGFNDITTNGSRDKCERVDNVTHPSWFSACEDSKDEVECKKLTMVLTMVLLASMKGVGATKDSRKKSIPCAVGCVDGFDDGATEDSDNHVKLLPCSDIPPCDNKEMLKGGNDQPWMLGMSKGTSLLSVRSGERLQTLGMSEGVSLHFAWLSSPAYASPFRHVEGCCLLKSTSTLNLAVLVSCTLLVGGSRWLLFFCCYKVVELYPSAPSSLCSPYAWTPQFFVLA
ncbi:uncharacterized protein G2W53_016660 [Senna tora]|uniref:Uncharacterized protein n=1 Tax=Senna tora TaxID=362788 RepID=A0A834TRC4_9FABA|nr:uncharacterized protein G2W53_016660 [Senna tora]